jgi:Clp amino terminal domain, pathogenicity island component
MTPLDLGALVVIAARVLGLDTPAVLDVMDVAAAEAALAEAALAEAGNPGPLRAQPPPAGTGAGLAGSGGLGSGDAASDPAGCAAALLSALIGHRPLPRGNEQAAVLATVTFLAINGWQADLGPPEATAGLVADLAAGRESAAGLAAWLSPRISAHRALPGRPGAPATTSSPAKEGPMHGWLPNLRRTGRRKGDLMFRRFSPRAREVVISAQQEARALHHGYIGTEHILLGLLRDRDGVAGRALRALGISAEAAREQVLDIIGDGRQEPAGHIPLTPRSKRVLELAVDEAVHLDHLHVGTEHILLGLVREGDGVGWHVLHRLGLTVTTVRDQVLELVSQDRQAPGHVITPPGIRDFDTRIELARQAKDAAIDGGDPGRAAAARETEKELLAGRERLIARWSAGVDVATLGRELDWLRDEVHRLQRLLLEHGIEPEQPARHPGGPAQQTA